LILRKKNKNFKANKKKPTDHIYKEKQSDRERERKNKVKTDSNLQNVKQPVK
jgi:hypothetical protein